MPVVLKGISSPEDAAIAAEMSVAGTVAGIVVSNHDVSSQGTRRCAVIYGPVLAD